MRLSLKRKPDFKQLKKNAENTNERCDLTICQIDDEDDATRRINDEDKDRKKVLEMEIIFWRPKLN